MAKDKERKTWVSTTTLDDDDIVRHTFDILDKPAVMLCNDENTKGLYSEEQMIKMFRIGFKTKALGPYRLLSKLEIDDIVIFPYEVYGSVRNAIYILRKTRNRDFHMTKATPRGVEGDIIVVRTS